MNYEINGTIMQTLALTLSPGGGVLGSMLTGGQGKSGQGTDV